MKEYEYISRLKAALIQENYDDDYIKLCNDYSYRLLENSLPVIFDKEHLSRLLGLEERYFFQLFMMADGFYKEVQIPKKKLGQFRNISVPTEVLKYVQRWILDNVLYNIRVSEATTGFVKGKSIVDNAKKHVRKECVINMDLKDFFPTITYDSVFRLLKYYGYTNEIAFILSKLCTFRDVLPQGAPTSPFISNIVCYKLDIRFIKLCNKIGADYSRYADDLTISGPRYIVGYLNLFSDIIVEEGFQINESKTRIQYPNNRQEVTGLIVNDKISVPKETKKYLRQQIFYCKKYGVNSHLRKINIQKSNYKEHLYGIAFFIKMVELELGEKFLEQLNEIEWDY
ncbi:MULTISPECIES: retron St85 family RNA-directed DNA polymerase [Paenibacillus]|uniref:retron St85 family RNA-directed DNA polymerase n=1 Tax=Paenibacillus TaxID=44249 RepID=UPI0009D6F181|nr:MULTISPECIES: retron St85 family RNA-directed DNA polymerase [Paenibacillus]MDH6428068.1 RNA-directed DNA polymerase [Paenibacillus sp. PastH-4]MDH6444302.1 RNA-directed DNA polymerase [Paenibacillus sp. PastF-4]MDH6528203.1 RNA-directed DNA polymerase [Paenibacillus sp. PastH-3]